MTTGNARLALEANQVLGADDLQLGVDYHEEERQGFLAAILREDVAGATARTAYALGTAEVVTVGNPGGPTATASVGGAVGPRPKAAVVARGDIAAGETVATIEVVTWDGTEDGMTAVPFDVNGTSTYQIGLRAHDVPARATHRTDGAYNFDRWEHAIGIRRPGSAISEPVPGAGLRIQTTAIVGDEVSAWTNVGLTRPVRVWYTTDGVADGPCVTASAECYYDGALTTDGANLWVDVPHYFGQDAAAWDNNSGHYTLHVFGLSITDAAVKDLEVQLSAAAVRQYLVLATFDSATLITDHNVQLVVPSLQGLAAGAGAVGSLLPILRAGLNIGEPGTTREWNDAANVVVAVGATVTLTYTDPFVGPTDDIGQYFVWAGSELAVAPLQLAQAFRAGGLVAAFPAAWAAANYWVICETDAWGEAYLRVISNATLAAGGAALARRLIVVANFDWTGAAVNNYAPVNLNDLRGVVEGHLLGSGAASGGAGAPHGLQLAVHELSGYVDPTAEAYTEVRFVGQLPDGLGGYDANRWARWRLNVQAFPTMVAESDLAVAAGVDLSAAHSAVAYLGGRSNDYSLRAVGSAADVTRQFYLQAEGAAGSVAIEHERQNGAGTGVTDRILVGDLHLRDEKDVWHQVPLGGAASRGWYYHGGDTSLDYEDCAWHYEATLRLREAWFDQVGHHDGETLFTFDAGTTYPLPIYQIANGDEAPCGLVVPHDFKKIHAVHVRFLPMDAGAVGAGKDIDLTLNWGKVAESYATHTAADVASTYAITAIGTWEEIEFSTLLAANPLEPGDYLALRFGNNSGGILGVAGLRLEYWSRDGWDPSFSAAGQVDPVLDIDITNSLGVTAAEVANGATLRDVRIYGGCDDDILRCALCSLDLDPVGPVFALTTHQTNFWNNVPAGDWRSLTPGAPIALDVHTRYFIRCYPDDPDLLNKAWWVNAVQVRTRIAQIT